MVLIYTTPPIFMVWSALFNIHCSPCAEMCCNICHTGGADKSLAHPGRKKANVSVRMMWISFGTLPYRKKTLWQLVSQCCWNRACPWHASELVSFLVGLRSYQNPGICNVIYRVAGDRSGTVVKVLCYKSEGRWFDPSWCHWNFFLT